MMLVLTVGVESEATSKFRGYAVFIFAISVKALVGAFGKVEIFACRNV